MVGSLGVAAHPRDGTTSQRDVTTQPDRARPRTEVEEPDPTGESATPSADIPSHAPQISAPESPSMDQGSADLCPLRGGSGHECDDG